MKAYKIRVDYTPANFKDIIDTVISYSPTTYVYGIEGSHEDGSAHIHFYAESDKNPTNLRTEFRKLGLRGNRSYSLKQLDELLPIEYISYIIKDDNFVSHGVSDSIIQSSIDHNRKVLSEIKAKKVTKKHTLQILTELCEGHTLYSQIAETVLQYHLDNNLLFRKFQIQSYCDTIAYRLDITNFRIQYIQSLLPLVQKY